MKDERKCDHSQKSTLQAQKFTTAVKLPKFLKDYQNFMPINSICNFAAKNSGESNSEVYLPLKLFLAVRRLGLNSLGWKGPVKVIKSDSRAMNRGIFN